MDKKNIVFDFDKTLTYKDSLLGFYMIVSKKKGITFQFKLFIYFIIMVTCKFGAISNERLKKIGIHLFLKGKSRAQLSNAAILYKQNIHFNKIFYEYNFKTENKIFIVSASFEIYLNCFFESNVHVIGSKLLFENDIVKGLEFNCYNSQKRIQLNQKGVEEIDILYTDSFADYPLAEISKKTIIVRKESRYECNNYGEFKSHFGK